MKMTMNQSCNDLCCAIKKACRMLWPPEEDIAWVLPVLSFVLDKWASLDCPEIVAFQENELLTELFGENHFEKTEYSNVKDMLRTFLKKIDIDIEYENFDDGGRGYSCESFRFFCNYAYDEEREVHAFVLADEKLCEMVREDNMGIPIVSFLHRDVEVRVVVDGLGGKRWL